METGLYARRSFSRRLVYNTMNVSVAVDCCCIGLGADISRQHEHPHLGDARGGPNSDSSPRSLRPVQQPLKDRLPSRGTLRMCLDR